MRYNSINRYLFEKNRQKLVRRLPIYSIAIIISNDEMPRSGDQFFPFRQNSDLFYLSGIEQSKTILTICPDYPDHHFHEILFIEKPTEFHQTWFGNKLSIEKVYEISGIKNVVWIDDFEKTLSDLMQHARHTYLSFHETARSFDEVPLRDARYTEKIKNLYPLHHYERLSPLMAELREIKEPEEIELIKNAIQITNKGFSKILASLISGISEYEIEAYIISEFIKHGASGHAFSPIVAAGLNACVLHYTSNHCQCNEGDLVLIDFGAEFLNYNADITRTLPVNGTYTKRQRDIYNVVLRMHDKTLTLIRPGTTLEKINLDLVPYFEEEMIELGLLSKAEIQNQNPEKPVYKKYFMHGVSHYLGLDVHDIGSKQDILMPGMVVTCEPGLYIRDEKIGIRLENDVLVTESGNINLSGEIPILPDEIEELMVRLRS